MDRERSQDRALYLRRIGFQPSGALTEAFGKLPRRGAKELEERVTGAFLRYYWAQVGNSRSSGSMQAQHYQLVRAAAERLAALLQLDPREAMRGQMLAPLGPKLDAGLGIALCHAMIKQAELDDDICRILTIAWPPPGGAVVEGILRGNRILLTHHAALRMVTLFLKPLVDAAQRAYEEAVKDIKRGRGGQRHTQRKPTTSLLGDLVEVYAVMRQHFPKSGPPLGYSKGGPLERFIHAALACGREQYPELRYISEGAIRATYRAYRPKPGQVAGSLRSRD